MKITVIFKEKRFIVVISHSGTVNDLKEEIQRVYTALFPDACPLPTPSKLQTLTGCVLYGGYTVSSVLSDNDIVTIFTDSIPDEATTHQMPVLPSDSSHWFCTYCGVGPMGCHSPVFATQSIDKGYIITSPQKHGIPTQYRLGTPTSMSSRARNVSIQCPSPERSSEDNTRPHPQTNNEESSSNFPQGGDRDWLYGNTPTVSESDFMSPTSHANDKSSASITLPEVQRSVGSSTKKRKKQLTRGKANAESISRKNQDVEKVVPTSFSDSQIASAVNLKSSTSDHISQAVVSNPGRQSQRVASASATLRMKECIESPPSKMDIRKRKLAERTESDAKKAKVVKTKKDATPKLPPKTQTEDDDSSDWVSTDDNECGAGNGYSSSKTTATTSEVKSKSHESDESTSEWESGSEIESPITVEMLVNKSQTTVKGHTSDSGSNGKIPNQEKKVDAPEHPLAIPKTHGRSKKAKEEKSNTLSRSSTKNTSENTFPGLQRGRENESPHGSPSGSSMIQKIEAKKKEEVDDTTAISSSEWSSAEESAETSASEVRNSLQPKGNQRGKRITQSTKKSTRKSGGAQKEEPSAMSKNTRGAVVLTDTPPTNSREDKKKSGQLSKRANRAVSKDTESRNSLRNTKFSGTPVSKSVDQNPGRNGTVDNQNEGSDSTTEGKFNSVENMNSEEEDRDSENSKSQAEKTLEYWSTVSSPPKGVYTSWDRQRLKQRNQQRSSGLNNPIGAAITELHIVASEKRDESPSGDEVESGTEPNGQPDIQDDEMLKESPSNEIFAPNSLSDEDIAAIVLSQSDDDIATIKETQEFQDCSRSPSPEIPFLNHSEPQSSTPNQKLQDNVTLKNHNLPSSSEKDMLGNEVNLPVNVCSHPDAEKEREVAKGTLKKLKLKRIDVAAKTGRDTTTLDSNAEGKKKEQKMKVEENGDNYNETVSCDVTIVPSSQTDGSDEDMECDDDDSPTGAGTSVDIGTNESLLKLSRVKSKSEKSIAKQSELSQETDETNVTSESGQSKGKRKQKKKRKNKKGFTVVDQTHNEENLTESLEHSQYLAVESESQETVTSTDNDMTEHTSEMSDRSGGVATQSLEKKRKKHKRRKKSKEGLKSTITEQLEVISEEIPDAVSVTGSDELSNQSPSQTMVEKDSMSTSQINAPPSPSHLTNDRTHSPQNNASATKLSDRKGFVKPMTPKKSLIPRVSPASKIGKSGTDSLSPSEQKNTNLLSIFSVTETEHSSAEESSCEHVGTTSGGEGRRKHGKKTHKLNFLSSLGSSRRKPKPAKRIVPLSRTALVTSSSQRRFSSETGVRMFSLTNSPTSAAARRAKLHSTARLSKLSPSKQKRREKTSPALDDILNEASVEVGQGDGGKVPSLSELLADGSLWDS